MDRRLVGAAGLIGLGLGPSYLDWQQSPGKRRQIVFYYAAVVALVWFGILR